MSFWIPSCLSPSSWSWFLLSFLLFILFLVFSLLEIRSELCLLFLLLLVILFPSRPKECSSQKLMVFLLRESITKDKLKEKTRSSGAKREQNKLHYWVQYKRKTKSPEGKLLVSLFLVTLFLVMHCFDFFSLLLQYFFSTDFKSVFELASLHTVK